MQNTRRGIWTGVLLYGKTIYAREELLEPVEIAKDGILILVGEKNPLQNITMDQLTKIYRGDISRWSDLAIGRQLHAKTYNKRTEQNYGNAE